MLTLKPLAERLGTRTVRINQGVNESGEAEFADVTVSPVPADVETAVYASFPAPKPPMRVPEGKGSLAKPEPDYQHPAYLQALGARQAKTNAVLAWLAIDPASLSGVLDFMREGRVCDFASLADQAVAVLSSNEIQRVFESLEELDTEPGRAAGKF